MVIIFARGGSPMAFDSTVNREIGLRLRGMREQRALTRERLAEYSDISVQFLADIETGRKGMTVQTLRKLALALHCTASASLRSVCTVMPLRPVSMSARNCAS